MELLASPLHNRAAAALTLILALAFTGIQPARASNPLHVGIYHNPPKLMMDEKGQPSGILGELLLHVAENENWELIPVPCDWQACLDMLYEQKLDLLPDVAFSEQRAGLLDFHQIPALHSWSQIYQGKGPLLNAIPDLDGMRVAILSGSIQQSYLSDLVASFGVNVHWVNVATLEEGFALVELGDVHAVVSNHHHGDLQALNMDLRATPIMFQPAKLFYASSGSRRTQELAQIDGYLSRWQSNQNSIYYRVLEKWAGKSPRLRITPLLYWTIAGLSFLLLLTLLFNLLLRRRVEARTRQLKRSEEKLKTILNSVEAYIYIKDCDLRYQYANQKVCNLFRATPEQVVGKSDEDFFDPETTVRLRHNDRQVIEEGAKVATEEQNLLTHGDRAHTFLSVKLPLRDAQGEIYALCGISTDITEYREIQEEIHQLAFYDPLTHLPNRRLLLERLLHALANKDRTRLEGALLFIDLDNFKNLNDTLGHVLGDELLKEVAGRLKEHLRATDSLARMGGDEFVILFEGLTVDPDEAAQKVKLLGQSMLERLSQPYLINGGSHVTTASIGVVLFSDAQDNAEELMKRSELAMYEAKKGGRNNLRFFNPVMQAEATRRATIEADLRLAIERNELALHVQPQVNRHAEVIGMEALLRWTHPLEGPIPPGSFIPIAESSGLIISLGEWVLNQACELLNHWAKEPETATLTLAVNISPRQFRHPDFVELVLGLLERNQFKPERLELEITESLLIEDMAATAERMQVLRQRGVRFSLDDFGTGYASLAYLKGLPLYQLKIDQSFIHDLLDDPYDVAIVKTIVALGNSLGLRVIAEGVESAAQHERLLELGCEYFQGYLFGRPAKP
ncbi:MAG: EAL domain-containing protein [Pseudomonas sp.]